MARFPHVNASMLTSNVQGVLCGTLVLSVEPVERPIA